MVNSNFPRLRTSLANRTFKRRPSFWSEQGSGLMSHQRKVYIVGRDQEVRRMLTQHVGAVGAEAWPFARGADFLEILDHLAPACVLLDMDESDVPGIEILAEMVARQVAWPVIAV